MIELLAQNIDLIRIVLLLSFLVYASYQDLKTRVISENVWSGMALVGIILLCFEVIILNEVYLIFQLSLNLLTVGVVSYGLWRLRVWYGADYKAMVAIILLVPQIPQLGSFPIFSPTFTISSYLSVEGVIATLFIESFAMYVLLVSPILGAGYLCYIGVQNFRRDDVSVSDAGLARYLTQQKIDVADIRSYHGRIAEYNEIGIEFFRAFDDWSGGIDYTELSPMQFKRFISETSWESDDYQEDVDNIIAIMSQDTVWIRPWIPFIIFITLASVLTLVVGSFLVLL